MSDGSFRHFHLKIICHRRTNNGKSILIFKGATLFHGLGISQEGNVLSGMVGAAIGGIIPVICGKNKKVILPKLFQKNAQVLVKLLDFFAVAFHISSVSPQGIEINQEMAMRCIERGIPTCHGDLEECVRIFQDKSFDFVILEETLQTLQHPIDVLREILRVGNEVVVSIPNFAHWRVRLAFSLGGRMPKTASLPHTWYNTPNIHLCTLNDFMDWIETDHVKILESWSLVSGNIIPYEAKHNLTAEQALFVLASN